MRRPVKLRPVCSLCVRISTPVNPVRIQMAFMSSGSSRRHMFASEILHGCPGARAAVCPHFTTPESLPLPLVPRCVPLKGRGQCTLIIRELWSVRVLEERGKEKRGRERERMDSCLVAHISPATVPTGVLPADAHPFRFVLCHVHHTPSSPICEWSRIGA